MVPGFISYMRLDMTNIACEKGHRTPPEFDRGQRTGGIDCAIYSPGRNIEIRILNEERK